MNKRMSACQKKVSRHLKEKSRHNVCRTDTRNLSLLVEKLSQFNLDRRSFFGIVCKDICKAGALETLIWGKDIANRVDDIKFIRSM